MMREASREEMEVCRDLGRKAAEDSRVAVMRVLDLAALAGGPPAVASVSLTAAGSAVQGLATVIAAMRAKDGIESGRALTVDDATPTEDDFLLASLYVAATYSAMDDDRARSVPRLAAEMFRKLTGRDPIVPLVFSEARGVAP